MAFAERIADNLRQLRQRMAEAAARSGRAADAVRLVGVTKYVGAEQARALVAAGCHDLGESRPQQLWDKAEALAELPVRWHLVGHLQRNKARRTLPRLDLLHSGHSLRLLEALNPLAAALPVRLPVLLEVNVSGDATKHGFHPDELDALLEPLAQLERLDLRGLMAMSGRGASRDEARRQFAHLRELGNRLERRWAHRFELRELSMGMSDDFEVAIEEGATLVRVGRQLFAGQADD